MLECRGVSAQVGSFKLREISFAIPTGGHAVLIGPTASGKTTLLELIAGAIDPTSGTVAVNDAEITVLPSELRGVGLVPQHGYLFPHLDARRNIEYGSQAPGAALDLARRFGIDHLLDRSVAFLSGGERQIVALCRALAPQPSVLLLDEPFSALDAARRAVTIQQFAALQAERTFTVLHVTHQESDAAIATQQFEMADGALV